MIRSLLFFILIFSEMAYSQKKVNQPVRPQSELQRIRQRDDQALLKGQQEKELKNELQALELILNNKLRKDGKNELLLRRAFIYFKIGRARLLADTKLEKSKASFFREATQAVNDLNALAKAGEVVLTTSQQALLLFIRGSIFQEIGPEKQFIEDFARAIKIDPKLPQSSSMALILGETYFDKENYKQALAWYQKLKDQYEPHQKSIADFKSGWSWLLLKETANAQFYFLRVANQKKSESFREDSVRALAFIVTSNKSETWIVEFAKKSILDEPLRLVFLSAAIQNFYNIDKTKVPYKLFGELYKRTTQPAAKIKVLGQLISFERREIPTVGQNKAFAYLETLVKKNPELPWREWMKESLDLEPDIRGYIQNFSDYYVGKVNVKLSYTKPQVVSILHRQLLFYSLYLMNATTQKPTMNLWLDLIHREQSFEMITDVIKVLNQLKPVPLDELERAKLESVAILDGQVRDKKTPAKVLIAEVENYLAEFPNTKERTRLLNRLAELYMLDEQFEKALPSLQQLLALEPNETNSYNVVWSLFKLNRLPEVVLAPALGLYPKSIKIQEVYRETHLKLAQQAQEQGNDLEYQANLKKYLSLNPTFEQSNVVKASLLSSYLTKNDLPSYCSERAKLSDKEKSSKIILDTEEIALDKMFLSGPLLNCSWAGKKGPQSRDFKLLLYSKSMKKPLTKDDESVIWKMNDDQQSIFWGLMAMAEPQKMSQVKLPSKVSSGVLDLFWLSLQVSQNTDNPTIPSNLKSKLGNRNTSVKPLKTTSTINKIIKEATFPNDKTGMDRFSKILEDLIYRSKLIKTKFQKESADLASSTKKTVLEEASEFERKIASAIRNSPAPQGLSAEELTGYKAELDKAAIDFDKQAEEYDKALGDVKARLWVEEQEAQANKITKVESQNWFWQGDEYTKFKQSLSEYGPFYTLLKLETNRSTQALTELDYARTRAGVLLMIRNDEFMRGQVRRELVALNAVELLDKWKAAK